MGSRKTTKPTTRKTTPKRVAAAAPAPRRGAKRVTRTIEPPCRHEAWEATQNGADSESRVCADCREYLGTFQIGSGPGTWTPARYESTEREAKVLRQAMVAMRKELDKAATEITRTEALRVWWIPQIPGKPFRVEVASVAEARKILSTLADYDRFQYKHTIKPDYCNAGGLEVEQDSDEPFDWAEWRDDDDNDVWGRP